MKHLIRTQTSKGFGLPDSAARHAGASRTPAAASSSRSRSTWRKTATGGQSAENTFAIPPAAKLGVYEVMLRSGKDRPRAATTRTAAAAATAPAASASRNSACRCSKAASRPTDKKPLVAVTAVPTDVQINYVAGGGAANLPVRVSALVRGKSLELRRLRQLQLRAAAKQRRSRQRTPTKKPPPPTTPRVIADKLPVTLDRNGAGKVTVDKLPAVEGAARTAARSQLRRPERRGADASAARRRCGPPR